MLLSAHLSGVWYDLGSTVLTGQMIAHLIVMLTIHTDAPSCQLTRGFLGWNTH